METGHIDQLADGLVGYRRRRYLSMAGLLALLVIIIGVACSVGSEHISLSEVLRVFLSSQSWTNPLANSNSNIIINARLPEILVAALVGAALSTAGATYQGVFRNPLADPSLLGVAQASALGGIIGLIYFPVQSVGIGSVPTMALCTGIIGIVMLYLFGRVGKTLPIATVLLSGIALNAFFSATNSWLVIRFDSPDHPLGGVLHWLMGGVSNAPWTHVYVLLPYLAVCLIPICLYSRALNLMQLDEEQAKQLGVNLEKVKIILLLSSTLLTAAAVSFAGCIGFVGIIIPHTVRLIWGPDYRFLLPLSTIVGAIFLVLTNALARILHGELPLGVITAWIGAPFFLFLLKRKKQVFF